MIQAYPEPIESDLGEGIEADRNRAGEKPSQSTQQSLGAIPMERLHSVLRGMAAEDWTSLLQVVRERLGGQWPEESFTSLDRLFRNGAGTHCAIDSAAFQAIQAITQDPVILARVQEIQERMRDRVRFVIREMPEESWTGFASLLAKHLPDSLLKGDCVGVLQLVFRIGESVSNVETAAHAMADRQSGRKLIQPEVARKNALITVFKPGVPRLDPEQAYRDAAHAIQEAEQTARRAENTIAHQYVEPSSTYRHARNTVFKLVEWMVDVQELRRAIEGIGSELDEVKPVTREQVRWALHRMPLADRMKVIKLIPLNTVLMFQECDNDSPAGNHDLNFKAIRDRRLAYQLFIAGQSDSELMEIFGFSLNALKNAVGIILQTIAQRPMARRLVRDYLDRVEKLEPMCINELRRRMKGLSPVHRAKILSGLPNSAWKARNVILLHKHLFLDYMMGDWVLAALVEHYNGEKLHRLAGKLGSEGELTVRGAHSAIAGILTKIAGEPELCEQLRMLCRNSASGLNVAPTIEVELKEPSVEELMPAHPPPFSFSRSASM